MNLVELVTQARDTQGGTAEVTMGGHDVILVSEPVSAHRVLVRNEGNYIKLKHSHRTRVLTGDGLLNATGTAWRRQRKVLQPQFTSRGLQRYEEAITASVRAAAARWADHARTTAVFDVAEEMKIYSQDVIWRSITGRPLDDDVTRDLASVERVVATLKAVPSDAEAARLAMAEDLSRIDDLAHREIARTTGNGVGFLNALVAARKTRPEYTDQLVRDELITLFSAGYETTATALTWTFVLLHRNPEAQADNAQALITEAMRLYPPVWLVPREAVADDVLDGRPIKAGTQVVVCPYLIHRDPAHWRNPETFDPSRFTKRENRHPAAYLPFGTGPRTCLGMQFAMKESVALLEAVLPRYRTEIQHVPTGVDHGLTMRPDGPLPATATTNS